MDKKDKNDKNVLKKKVQEMINNEISFLLNICKKMEILMINLYDYFAEVFKDNEEIYKLWKKMVLEEENHVKHFELAMKISSEAIDSLNLNRDEIIERFNSMQEVVNRAKKTPLSLSEAFRIAIDLEEELEDIHISTISKFKNPSFKKLFDCMKSCDEGHIEILKQIQNEVQK
jgi:rubrerythrin